jgi:hypothetical protein
MPRKVVTQGKEEFFTSSVGAIRDRIVVHESEDIPREGLFVGLNGVQILIKPGFEVDIPRPIRLMLDTRIRTDTTQDADGGRDFKRDIRRVTYTMIKEDVDGLLVPPADDLTEGATAP